MVYILLADGFEEAEALVPCDLLRRAGIEVRLAGIGKERIRGGHGIVVVSDLPVEEIRPEDTKMLVLPGGLQGVSGIAGSGAARQLIREVWNRGSYVAAICAAPTLLAHLGITNGRRVICYPGMEPQMEQAEVLREEKTVIDGKLITGQAAGSAFEFGLALITALRGETVARKVAESIYFEPVCHR